MDSHYELFTFGENTCFDTIEDAIEFADKNGLSIIQEVGGNWEQWERCSFCNDWFPSCDLNELKRCDRCHVAIKDHETY